jgi:hypothetical protein
MKNIIKNWLERLERANKNSFGSEPLDCCKLGKDQKAVKQIKPTNGSR